MIKMRSLFLMLMGLMMLTPVFAQQPSEPGQNPSLSDTVQPISGEEEPIRVSGQGAVVPDVTRTQAQQKLMAMRASRMDAYRNLAERLYGIELEGITTVREMAARHDQVRSFIDRHVTGARVVETVLMDDNIYQTTLELTVGRRFYTCVSHPSTCNTLLVPAAAAAPAPAPRDCAPAACDQQPVYTRCPDPEPRRGACPSTDGVHAPYDTYH